MSAWSVSADRGNPPAVIAARIAGLHKGEMSIGQDGKTSGTTHDKLLSAFRLPQITFSIYSFKGIKSTVIFYKIRLYTMSENVALSENKPVFWGNHAGCIRLSRERHPLAAAPVSSGRLRIFGAIPFGPAGPYVLTV